jgi:hypothetical protein
MGRNYWKCQSLHNGLVNLARFWRVGPFICYLVLLCSRLPIVVRHGRFWAEEGTLYFHNAWTLSWHAALFRPEVGYLSLVANVSALAARWLVPLERAPHVTTDIAIAVQALPVLILCTARDEWLRRPSILFAAALLFALPAGCDEVWLNTPNSQFHIAVAVALCLVLQMPLSQAGRIARAVLVLLGPLCSPITCGLLPLFVARAALTRERARAVQAACLAVGGVIQLAVYLDHRMPERGGPMGTSVFLSVLFAKNLVLPFLGSKSGELLARDVWNLLGKGIQPFWEMFAAVIAFATLLGAALLRWRDRQEPLWFFLSAGTLAIVSYYASLGQHVDLVGTMGGNRYAFAPNMLGALAVLSLIGQVSDRVSRVSCAAIIWLLAIGFQDYVDPQMPTLVTGPSWIDGVKNWRSNPSNPIPIWPTGWEVRLQ